MLKYIFPFCIGALVLPVITMAQLPNGSAVPAVTAPTPQAAYTNPIINYVRTREAGMPTTDPAVLAAPSRTVQEVKQTTQYFDGLGRPLQTVVKGIGATGKDHVTPVAYDPFGLEVFKYLPYVQQGGNTNDGLFKNDPFNSQNSFYLNATLNPGVAGDKIFYEQVDYEPSPLSRVLKTYRPGNTWSKVGGNKPVELQYLSNTASDAIRVWNMPSGATVPVTTAAYTAGQLFKNITRDERGIRQVEYKDKEDRIVLRQSELTTGASGDHTGWLNTYYVYDDMSNLRFVIPPKAVELIKPTWTVSADVADKLCFQYQYDGKKRMISKMVPGGAPFEMVYDLRDRLVFTRDGNLKSKAQWQVIFYDGMNRPVMTALYNSDDTRDELQTSMNNPTGSSGSITYSIPAATDLTVASHDGREQYIARNSITFESGFECTAEMEALINSAAVDETVTVTANNPLPGISPAALTPLSYTFYDDYNYSGAYAAITGDFANRQAGGDPYAEFPGAASKMTKGLVTGTKVKVLGTTDQWLTTTTYYDDKGRVIQTIADNISGGKDVTTNLYNFHGELLSSYVRHRNLLSSSTPQTTVLTAMTYDHAGRLKTIKKKLNDLATYERTIVQQEYDELGQMKKKTLGINGSNIMENLLYEYNIRGWIKSINKSYVSSNQSAWFGQELNYDYGFSTNQYNGSIAGTKWKGRTDGIARAYGFTYDNSNRLTAAEFSQQNTTGATWTRDKIDFSVNGIAYDANGNINAMTQKGMLGTTIATIDQLTYTYQPNSNRIAAITDPGNTASAKLGDFINGTNTGDDYAYDLNGNLSKDENKGITSISYNHLNLPENIVIIGKGSIRYLYDANGNKIRKITTDNTGAPAKVTTTDYIGAFVYEDNNLQFVSHEEGRIRTVAKSGQALDYKYDYFIKDHLGNVRVVLTEQTDFSMYTATMETENAVTETSLFSNLEETRSVKPVGYPEDNTTRKKNAFVAKLNAKDGGKKIGPSLVLKVMAGDTVQIGARAFYKSTQPKNNKSVTPEDMVANLLRAFGGEQTAAASHGILPANSLAPFANVTGSDYQRLKERDPDQNKLDKPRSYLNYVLFDEQFNMVEENSGVRQVKGEPDELQTLAVDKLPVTKSGFLYVYTSNESQQDVFFDNVTVTAITGPLLEETHYYPYGLTMAGISGNALKGMNYPENRMRYNGKELQREEFKDGSGLELYDYGARMYDPQIGRWHRLDPLANKYEATSPFAYTLNNPINAVDPDGKLVIFVNGYYNSLFQGSTWGSKPTKWSFGPTKPGQSYWDFFDSRFVGAIGGLLNDTRYKFVDGSSLFGGDQSGGDRFARGRMYAAEHYGEWVAQMNPEEQFHLVGHSEGAAFAAGIASYLAENAWGEHKGHTVGTIIYLSADEADEFAQDNKYFAGLNVQVHNEKDPVSPYHPIKGVSKELRYTKGDAGSAHGSTVVLDVVHDIKRMIDRYNMGQFEVIETSDRIIFKRRE